MGEKLSINMLSSADKVKGQGVGSAYLEQVALMKECEDFDVHINNLVTKTDIQHFHTVNPDFFLRLLNKKCLNVAYCHFLPDTLDGSLNIPALFMEVFSKYVIEFYKSADKLVVVNPIFISDLVKYGVEEDRITYIPNYVSKDQFYKYTDERKLAIRKKYGYDENDFIVFDAGQVQHRKGVLDFVEVAKSCPDIQFVWAGGFSFGVITDGYEELKKVVENPPKNVRFLGIVPREEMVDLYNMSDVLFMPSYNELFPMTILEASNIEIPMVLRDLDLYKVILFDHYLKGNDNESFASIIKQLYENPVLYKMYALESKKIGDYYSKEHVMEMWKEFYINSYNEKFKKDVYEE